MVVSPSIATGTVAFKDNGVDIGGCGTRSLSGGEATCVTSALSVGDILSLRCTPAMRINRGVRPVP